MEKIDEVGPFYTVTDNSFVNKEMPWISTIVKGLRKRDCAICGISSHYPIGNIEAVLEPKRGRVWPDVLGCGSYPLFIVSNRIVDSWKKEGIGLFPNHRLIIADPIPASLRDLSMPEYFWIDGKKIIGAKFNFDASGFVDFKICKACGRTSFDVTATYKRRESKQYPYALVENSWNGSDLFTTGFSHALFFCTKRIVSCAYKHQQTNFRFLSVEQGADTFSKGIDYLSGDF